LFLLVLCRWRSCLFLLLSFEGLPELGPPLCPGAAGGVLAAGVDGAVWELDGKGSVPVGAGERAVFQGVDGAALVGFLAGDPDPVVF